jgi:hypothetical protein
MNETTLKLLTYAAVVALAAIFTTLTTDKKGWQITLLIVLVAGATYAEKVVDLFFEKNGPHIIVKNMPTRVEHKDDKIKISTNILLLNDGDRVAVKVVPETKAYVDGKLIGSYVNEHEMVMDFGEDIHIPVIIETSKGAWEGTNKLTMVMVAPYNDGEKAMEPMKKKWVFDPNKDTELQATWEVVPFE